MDPFRRIGSSLLVLLRTRVELFAVEMQEAKLRTVNLLVWLAVAIIVGAAGVLVAFGALALFLWQTSGYSGLIGMALAALGAAAATLWFVRRRIIHGPAPFAATVAELRKDAECLRPPV
jgi:uncharacterized membrane protein YqjE